MSDKLISIRRNSVKDKTAKDLLTHFDSVQLSESKYTIFTIN